jgi:protein-tyrosine phosphatase
MTAPHAMDDRSGPAGRAPIGRIALVCLGNICRSPMADVVLTAHIASGGLAQDVQVESFGTGDWHVGHPMDPRAAATLRSAGYDGAGHRARQIAAGQLGTFDLILAMDHQNLAELRQMSPAPTTSLRLFRDFDPDDTAGRVDASASDVPDPYYGGAGGFEEVLEIVERTATELVARLVAGSMSRSSR